MTLARFVAPFLLVAVLAGCASDPAPAAPTSAAAITDAQYLALVRDQGWVKPTDPDSALLQAGQSACRAIQATPADGTLKQWETAVDVLVSQGLSQRDAGGFLVYASARFCPDARAAYFPPAN